MESLSNRDQLTAKLRMLEFFEQLKNPDKLPWLKAHGKFIQGKIFRIDFNPEEPFKSTITFLYESPKTGAQMTLTADPLNVMMWQKMAH